MPMPLHIAADYECANARDIERLGDAEFSLRTQPDDAIDGGDYANADYYSAFRLVNDSSDDVSATVHIRESDVPETGRTLTQRVVTDLDDPAVDAWRPIPREDVDVGAEANTTTARLTVPAHGILDVASMYWMSHTQVMRRLGRLKGEHAVAVEVGSIGTTPQGRDIPVVALRRAGESAERPIIAVGATAQASELGTIAVMGVLEAALRGELDVCLARCRLVLLPVTNPDGLALGKCMANGVRRNVFFGFGDLDTGNAPPECEVVWRHVSALRPACYLEMHSYPHLNRPSFRPYAFDLALFPDEASAQRGGAFFAATQRVSPNDPVPVAAGSRMDEQFTPSLTGRLIQRLGIPATIYKLHNRETPAANVAQTIKVLRAVVEAMT